MPIFFQGENAVNESVTSTIRENPYSRVLETIDFSRDNNPFADIYIHVCNYRAIIERQETIWRALVKISPRHRV